MASGVSTVFLRLRCLRGEVCSAVAVGGGLRKHHFATLIAPALHPFPALKATVPAHQAEYRKPSAANTTRMARIGDPLVAASFPKLTAAEIVTKAPCLNAMV